MKKIILITAFVLLNLSLNVNADNKTEIAIDKVLDELHQMASKANSDKYFGLFTNDAVYIGTDVEEYWTLEEFKAFAEPYFGQGKGWTYHPIRRDIRLSKDGKFAWFHEVLKHKRYGTTRGTGTLVFDSDKGWQIAQYHLAFPVPNGVTRTVVEAIKAFEAKQKGDLCKSETSGSTNC